MSGLLNRFLNSSSEDRNKMKAYGPQQNHYVANCSSAPVTIPAEYLGCRFVEADVTGIIKVDYKGDNDATHTEVKIINAGELWRVPNVTKVYRYYVGTTACTAQSYTDAGVLVTGIKLRF